MQTAVAIETFEKVVGDYCEKPDNNFDKIIAAIKKVKFSTPPAYTDKQIAKFLLSRGDALADLAKKAVVSRFAQMFPLLSPELFSLRRHIAFRRDPETRRLTIVSDTSNETIKDDKNLVIVECPLFVYTPLDEIKNITIGKWSETQRRQDYYGYTARKKITTQLHAKLPGVIGPSLQGAYRKALAGFHTVMAELLNNETVSDIIMNIKDVKPEVGAIWIPTLDAIRVTTTVKVIRPKHKPVPIDPAMILNVMGNSFLVTMWQVDDEEPFQNYLREFSEGDWKKLL